MATRATKQCFNCKQVFRKEELVDYASPNAQILHSYCPACLKEKQAKDNFSMKVCSIFQLKAPGPRIWNERKRLIDKYGYTDEIIIDCLDYIYNVEHAAKLAESLCLVNPTTVAKMQAYKSRQAYNSEKIISAMREKFQTYVVKPREAPKQDVEYLNPDDLLLDE